MTENEAPSPSPPRPATAAPNGTVKAGDVYGNHYVVIRELGNGAFGRVFRVKDTRVNMVFALKLELDAARQGIWRREFEALEVVKAEKGFPILHGFGRHYDHNFVIMSLLGPSLESLLRICGGRFSISTVINIGLQVIDRIQCIHQKGYLHRDIKPENFCCGVGMDKSTIYMVDFGLSKSYVDGEGRHIPYTGNKLLTGTSRYASLYNHSGFEQGRRDDLESLWYMLVYMLTGSLPWQNVPAKTRQDKHNKVFMMKMKTKIEDLCEGFPEKNEVTKKQLKLTLMKFIHYVRSLEFQEEPDYTDLRLLLKTTAVTISEGSLSFAFDWITTVD